MINRLNYEFARYAIFALLLVTATSSTWASSEDLIKACRIYSSKENPSPNEALVASHCYSYIFGFSDGIAATLEMENSNLRNFCFPHGTSWVQLAAVYVRWADIHPELWQLPERETVKRSFASAFPCD
jgi:Rap1a immunity proteins